MNGNSINISKLSVSLLTGAMLTLAGVFGYMYVSAVQDLRALEDRFNAEQIHLRENYVPEDEYNRDYGEIKMLIKDLDDDVKEGFRLVTEKLEREVN